MHSPAKQVSHNKSSSVQRGVYNRLEMKDIESKQRKEQLRIEGYRSYKHEHPHKPNT